MGGLISTLSSWIAGKRQVRVLILGLDCAGKTTILYRLQLNRVEPHYPPTVAFNLETVDVGNLKLQIWDLGGQDQLRAFWYLYFTDTNGVLFVIDSADRGRIELCANELKTLLTDEGLQGIPLCVVANKQDLANAMTVEELTEKLELRQYRERTWTVVPASAVKGDGVKEAFEWLAEAIDKGKR
jgi:small GTP-binding protein